MKALSTTALAFAVAAALLGCGSDGSAPKPATADASDSITETVDSSLASAASEVRQELATQTISLDGGSGVPKAEITPAGDLLIDGRAVQVTDAQRRLLLDYRMQVAAIASAGAEVGIEGARLATRAVGEALRGVLDGDADEVGKRVEAQADSVRQSAMKLCDRLPAMYERQQALAAALPEFAPYATMDRADIDDCRIDATDGKPPAAPVPPTPPAAPEPPANTGGIVSAAPTAGDRVATPGRPQRPGFTA